MRILSVFDKVLRRYQSSVFVNIETSICCTSARLPNSYPLPEQLPAADVYGKTLFMHSNIMCSNRFTLAGGIYKQYIDFDECVSNPLNVLCRTKDYEEVSKAVRTLRRWRII